MLRLNIRYRCSCLIEYLQEVVIMTKETKTKNVQISVTLPESWRIELERLARIYSVEEETTLTYQDLMRRAIDEKYNLESENE